MTLNKKTPTERRDSRSFSSDKTLLETKFLNEKSVIILSNMYLNFNAYFGYYVKLLSLKQMIYIDRKEQHTGCSFHE